MKKYLFIFLAAIWFSSGPVMAQRSANGTITASAASCTTAGACVQLTVDSNTGGAGVVVSGTYVGTLQFEGTVDGGTWTNITGDPLPTGASVSSTTSTGSWIFNVTGLLSFRVRASAYTSGGANVTIHSSTAFAKNRSFGNLNVANLNNIRYADQFPGADAGEQIIACTSNLPATGGTCDAQGLEGEQTAAASFSVGSATKPVRLLLGAMTLTTSGIIYVYDKSGIVGIGEATKIKQANSVNLQSVISINTNPLSATVPLDTYLEDFNLDGNAANNTTVGSVNWGVLVGSSNATGQKIRAKFAGLRITETRLDGVYVNNVSEASVKDSIFLAVGRSAIRAEGSLSAARETQNTFTDNLVDNYGKYASGGGIAFQLINNDSSIVEDNEVVGVTPVDPTPTITSLEGIQVSNGSGNIVSGNTVDTTGAEGITVTNEPGALAGNTNGNIFSNNTVRNPWTVGFSLAAQNASVGDFIGNVFKGNTIYNPIKAVQAGYTVAAGYDGGIRITGAKTVGTILEGNNTIDDRATRRVDYCVSIDNAGDLALKSSVSGNVIYATDTAGTWDVLRNAAGATTDRLQWNRSNQLIVAPGGNSTDSVIFYRTDGTTKVATVDTTNSFLRVHGPGKLAFLGATSGSVTVEVPAVAGSNAWVLPAATDTLIGKATADAFTNKGFARSDVTLANGANNDINIGTANFVGITGPTGAFSVSGFTGGVNGRVLFLFNSVAQTMTITNDATSTAGNRISTLTGGDVILRATAPSFATFIYNTGDSYWKLVATN